MGVVVTLDEALDLLNGLFGSLPARGDTPLVNGRTGKATVRIEPKHQPDGSIAVEVSTS